MIRVDVRSPGIAGQVIDAMRDGAVVIQFPAVYVLVAAPTERGVSHLNGAKQRLSGKNYGTAIGSMDRFWSCVDRDTVPPGLGREALDALIGAFVRCRFAAADVHSSTMRAGTHQGLLLEAPWRPLFAEVEEAFAARAEPALFGGHRYTAPLCTSFNRSGDPDGSIVDRDVALRFAGERDIGLFVTCDERASSLGSYPIFAFGPGGVTVERRGPRLEELISRFPEPLRPSAI